MDSRVSVDLGDILTFQVLSSAPSGVMTEVTLIVTDEDNYEKVTTIELIIGEAIPLVSYSFEETAGWMVGVMGDDATAGIWDLAVPEATFFVLSDNRILGTEDSRKYGPIHKQSVKCQMIMRIWPLIRQKQTYY